MSEKLFILAPYPFGQAPSQRFRFEQYMDTFKDAGFEVEFHPFLNEKTWKSLYVKGSFFKKGWGMMGSFWRRFILLFKLRKANRILIHREASMVGPPIFEWAIAKLLRKRYIYDFDDAIWLPNYSDTNARFHRLKAYGKVKKIMKWAGTISAGNQYLMDYALQFNKNVSIIPTTIDLKNVHNRPTNQMATPPVIGWTGTHTTMHYLDELLPVLQDLEKEYQFIFRVISNEEPSIDLKSLEFVKWNKASEIEDLSSFSIGVMPLSDTVWAKGKCGFKGLQYMALEIPSIMSPVGVNTTIIDHGINGYLCQNPQEWKSHLIELLENPELRLKIGKSGHQTVKDQFSVSSNKTRYVKLLQP